jgi:hypothetical protein
MSNNVYANNEEVACKAGMGKSICAFPDVCFTPPENPATPPGVPVPYPNTGMDSDTTDGSRTVQINGQEAMLKNKSYFKQSMGDEAGCAAKKGVVTSVNRGKVYFIAWSMDVKFEGENVVRNLDMTTHNHASPVANTPPQIFAARMAMADIPGCEGQRQQVKDACGENGEKFTCPDDKPLKDAKEARQKAKDAAGDAYKSNKKYKAANKKVDKAIDKMAAENKGDDCRKKMRCLLSPYDNDKCCPGQTPHHLVEAGAFHDQGRGGFTAKDNVQQVRFVRSMFDVTKVITVDAGKGKVASHPVFGAEKYDEGAAPCVCCEGESQNQGTHKAMHQAQDKAARAAPGVPNPNPEKPLFTQTGKPAKMQRLDGAISSGVDAMQQVFPESGCDPACLKAQLDDYHYNKAQMNPQLPIKAVNGQGKALPAK